MQYKISRMNEEICLIWSPVFLEWTYMTYVLWSIHAIIVRKNTKNELTT